MPKKKTHEEFVHEINIAFPNIEVLGHYINSSTPILFHCTVCGHEWNQAPQNLLNSHGCTTCSGAQYEMKSRDTFIDELSQLNSDIIVIGNYLGNKKPITVKCAKCGHIWNPKPNNLLSGHGCPKCAKRNEAELKIQKHSSIFLEKLKTKNPFVTIVSDYIGSGKPITAHCTICTHNWITTPESLLHGEICPACYEKEVSEKKMALELARNEDSKKEIIKVERKDKLLSKRSSAQLQIRKEERLKKVQAAAERKIIQEKRAEEKRQRQAQADENKKQNSLEKRVPLIASEWNYERNAPLTPKDVFYGSGKKVWWRCRFGHEYECRISDRVNRGIGCKKCAKRYRISLREHTFLYYIKQYFPDAISSYQPEWLQRKELDVYIPSLMVGVEYDGQYYHVDERDIEKDKLCMENGVILIRIREPKCSPYDRTDPVVQLGGLDRKSIENGIKKILPLISSTEKYDVNTERDRNAILASYYDAAIPGSISEAYPDLAKEWDYKLNGDVKPENVPATRSLEKYHWKCTVCGCSWYSSLSTRINGSGCPACSPNPIYLIPGHNDFGTTNKEIAAEWHPYKNLPLTPQDITKSSSKVVWWKCSVCGHEWKCSVECRAEKHTGCRRCVQRKRAEENARKVYKYSLEGILLQEYKDIDTAAKENRISRSSLYNACNGKVQSCAGYQWRYDKQEKIDPYTRPYTIKESRVIPRHRDTKKVYKYGLDGQFIQEYAAAWEAAKELHVDESAIRSVCAGKRNTCAGYQWSYDKVEQMGSARISKDKKVYKYDLNGFFVQEYKNSQTAAAEYNVKRGTINSACQGKLETCAGYQWRYQRKKRISPICSMVKKVYKYDLNGNYLQEYENAELAANEYHVTRSAIQKVCLGDAKTCAGYQWSYKKNDKLEPPHKEQQESKKVYQYDLDGHLLNEYENQTIAAKAINVSVTAIRYACKGKTKTCAGYKWSYDKKTIIDV